MPRPRNWLAIHAHNRRAWTQRSGKAAQSRNACRGRPELEELDAVDQDDPDHDGPDQDQD